MSLKDYWKDACEKGNHEHKGKFLNFGAPACDLDVNLPANLAVYVRRDRNHVNNLLSKGIPRKIGWKGVKDDLQKHLSIVAGKPIRCHFINVDNREFRQCYDDSIFCKGIDVIIFHTTGMVLLCCPSSDLSKIIYGKARDACYLYPMVQKKITTQLIKEIQKNQQPLNWPHFIANFGVGMRNQPATTFDNIKGLARNLAAGTTRFVYRMVNYPINGSQNISAYAKSVYETICFPLFEANNANCEHYSRVFHGKNPARKRLNCNFRDRKYLPILSLMNSSLPETMETSRATMADVWLPEDIELRLVPSEPGVVSIARFENECRTLSEWMMLNIWFPLPLSNTLHIAALNSKAALHENNFLDSRPFARLFPKGSLSNALHGKPMHDDENGAVSPSIWTNLTESGNDEFIAFETTKFRITLKCSKFRVVYFMGFVPHMTFTTREEEGTTSERVSHSCYSKPELEYLGLVMFDRKRRDKSLRCIEKKH